jgi:DNA-binding transcriptional ArsR family regulator
MRLLSQTAKNRRTQGRDVFTAVGDPTRRRVLDMLGRGVLTGPRAAIAIAGVFLLSGQELSYTFTASTGNLVTCTYDPHANGADFPVQVGQTWQIQYTRSCGNGSAPISYNPLGSWRTFELHHQLVGSSRSTRPLVSSVQT